MFRALDFDRRSGIKRVVPTTPGFVAIPVEFMATPIVLWGICLTPSGEKQITVSGAYSTNKVTPPASQVSLKLPMVDVEKMLFNDIVSYIGRKLLLSNSKLLDSIHYRLFTGADSFAANLDAPGSFFQLMMNAGNDTERIKELFKSHIGKKLSIGEHGALTIK